ncbi:MAG: ADP-glyceromanno-heptose 6-epimerase [Vicinamibacteraceae bacterium]
MRALNARGEADIVAVDDRSRGPAPANLADCRISDYLDKTDFLERFVQGRITGVRALLHQGACSDTMETDRRYVMDNNLGYSRQLLQACAAQRIPLVYASSAAVYGGSDTFVESVEHERPLNTYAESKQLFDKAVRDVLREASGTPTSQIVGLRYFNVYGPHEAHKGRMASVAFHNFTQFRTDGRVTLFGAYGGFGPGQQMRDFVSVDDVVAVNLYFLDRPELSGIFNVGTGVARPFNDVAAAVVNTVRRAEGDPAMPLDRLVQEGLIQYVPFPDGLRGAYQCFTQADASRLRAAGYTAPFVSVEQGVARYCEWLLRTVGRSAILNTDISHF